MITRQEFQQIQVALEAMRGVVVAVRLSVARQEEGADL